MSYPDYQGSNRTHAQYSRQVLEHVKSDLLSIEPELYKTKWWDYRFLNFEGVSMHPMNATHLFAYYYNLELAASVARRTDIYVSKGIKSNQKYLLKKSKSFITGLWKARQTADKFGIPYRFFCYASMKYAETFGWSQVPHPRQMYSNKPATKENPEFIGMLEFIKRYWAERNLETPLVAESKYYIVEGREELSPDHIEHMQYLLWVIENNQNKIIRVCEYVYERKILTEKMVLDNIEDAENILSRAYKFNED